MWLINYPNRLFDAPKRKWRSINPVITHNTVFANARYCAASSAVRTPTRWFKTNFFANTHIVDHLEALIQRFPVAALTGTLPVDVLIKSAPALIEISDALRMKAQHLSTHPFQ